MEDVIYYVFPRSTGATIEVVAAASIHLPTTSKHAHNHLSRDPHNIVFHNNQIFPLFFQFRPHSLAPPRPQIFGAFNGNKSLLF